MNCQNQSCQHEIRQRKDNTWAHAKVDYNVKEPKSGKQADTLYLARACMMPNCNCDNPTTAASGGGMVSTLGKLKSVGEGMIEAVSQALLNNYRF